LDRAASAQRATMDAQAEAGVWVEVEAGGAEVCVVSADGRLFRRAPLPVDATTPRLFAAIAASLLDEVLHPAQDLSVDVRVDVDVKVNGQSQPVQVAAAPASSAVATQWAAPGVIAPVAAAAAEPAPVARADRTLLEIGPMLSPLSAGIEAELSFPLSERMRLGAIGALNSIIVDTPQAVLVGAVELRHVGRGMKHNDIGLVAGMVHVAGVDERIVVVGTRLQRKWELERSAVSISLVPLVSMTDRQWIPGIYTSLRWDLPI
ncbi:MAG: hypothetical protein KIT31_43795, partial [Deltaproteobacteria bacterium]|nr:hypothetical protein [Deltaproteobacteria bacterium]